MSKWLNWKPIDKEKTLLKLMLDLYHNEVDAHYNVEQFLKSNYEGKYAIPEKKEEV